MKRRHLPAAIAVTVLVLALASCFPNLSSAGQQQALELYTQASYSPDGLRLAFISTKGGGTPQIYVATADGSNVKQLTEGSSNANPAWSPDGRKIIFSSNRGKKNEGDYDLWVMNADGSNPQRVEIQMPEAQ